MSTRVLLVRHGATVLSAEDRFAGSTNVELSEGGEQQSERLATRLAGLKLAAVYSSPLERTRRTAEIIAAPHRLEVETVDALREMHHGHWEQRRRAEVEQIFRNEYQAWENDPFTFAPEGGETGLAVLARALPALGAIVENHTDQTVLVVSHKATIRLLIGSLLGFDLRGYRDCLDQHPCCLNVVDFKHQTRARLMLLNDISHYEDHPETTRAALSKWWDDPKV